MYEAELAFQNWTVEIFFAQMTPTPHTCILYTLFVGVITLIWKNFICYILQG